MSSVLDYLHYGKQNAATREYLSALTGLKDRSLRSEINRLRVQEGHPIFNTQDGTGYFLATQEDKAEMDACYNMLISRLCETQKLVDALAKARYKVLNPSGTQIGL